MKNEYDYLKCLHEAKTHLVLAMEALDEAKEFAPEHHEEALQDRLDDLSDLENKIHNMGNGHI